MELGDRERRAVRCGKVIYSFYFVFVIVRRVSLSLLVCRKMGVMRYGLAFTTANITINQSMQCFASIKHQWRHLWH